MSSFNDLSRQLQNLQRKIEKSTEEVNGEVSFNLLFNENFMERYTEYGSIEKFFNNNGLNFKTQEGFNQFPEAELDKIVQAKTKFNSWEEMKQTAGKEYVKKKFKEQGIHLE